MTLLEQTNKNKQKGLALGYPLAFVSQALGLNVSTTTTLGFLLGCGVLTIYF